MAARWRPLNKARSRRREAPKAEEEFVKEVVSEETGVHFEVVPPHPAFPLPTERLEWFMRCRNKDEIAKAPYLNVVWKEKGGGIWLESLAVGDTVDWIEIAYGDERAGDSLNIDYSQFDDPAVKADFERRFPVVMGRIREYEAVAAAISKERKVRLQLRHVGSKGFLVFTVAALVVSRKGASLASLRAALTNNASALKEAYQQIEIQKL